jgi:hypothetical protein
LSTIAVALALDVVIDAPTIKSPDVVESEIVSDAAIGALTVRSPEVVVIDTGPVAVIPDGFTVPIVRFVPFT